MNLDISQFNDLLVDFPASHVKDAAAIWVTKQALEDAVLERPDAWTKASVQKRFAYCIPSTETFAGLSFDESDRTRLYADRYGGVGIGPNGGAGRTGIVDGFQIKGIGKTPLLGKYPDNMEWHFNGGMSLIDGVLEAINSEVFGHILPVGVVKVCALIYLGPEAAYMPTGDWGSERGPGALLVRESCLRPAHFLRAAHFKVRSECQGLIDDVERTRRVNKQLFAQLGGHHGVIRQVGDFLSRCAQQFAFAQAFRIWHGVLSPSNLAFDGRWLDLTNIGFVDSGVNYCSGDGQVPFYSEGVTVLKYLEEFIYTYTKYNHMEFNIKPLAKYYLEEMNAATMLYTANLLGLSADPIEDQVAKRSLEHVTAVLRRALEGDTRIVYGAPTGLLADPVGGVLESLFLGLAEPSKGSYDTAWHIRTLFEHKYRTGPHRCSYASFVIDAAIQSLKKAYFYTFFRSGRIAGRILELLRHESHEFFGPYIDAYADVAEWVFQKDTTASSIIFSSPEWLLSYDRHSERYTVTKDRREIARLRSATELASWLRDCPATALTLDGHDFKPMLFRLLDVLDRLETLGCDREVPTPPSNASCGGPADRSVMSAG